MIKVSVPNICQPEIKYTIDCLLSDFLGLTYEIIIDANQKDFAFFIGKQSLRIKNHFFDSNDITELYRFNRIPESIDTGEITIGNSVHTINTIYGTTKLEKRDNQYNLDADIISSTFFMLSRWEEKACRERDNHNRFDEDFALAIKQNFFDKPIVNEYVDLLYSALLSIGLRQKKKQQQYTPILSHDIDYIKKWKHFSSLINESKKNIKKRQFLRIPLNLGSFFFSKIQLINDPYDNLIWLSEIAKRKGVLSTFYFMSGISNSKYDQVDYDLSSKKMRSIVDKLLDNGCKVGLHPSYESYLSKDVMTKEVRSINLSIDMEIEESRQHYLRIQIPETFRILEDLGINYDSSLLYGKNIGFRNGVCYDFPIFDILERRKMKIIERPLIFMENHHLNTDRAIMHLKFKQVIDRVKYFEGSALILWHNSNLDSKERKRQFLDFIDLL